MEMAPSLEGHAVNRDIIKFLSGDYLEGGVCAEKFLETFSQRRN
jgi:hypothetical protein